MASNKLSFSGKPSVVSWLFAGALVQQAVYHTVLHQHPSEELHEDMCPSLHEQGVNESSQCKEVRLFRTWQQESESHRDAHLMKYFDFLESLEVERGRSNLNSLKRSSRYEVNQSDAIPEWRAADSGFPDESSKGVSSVDLDKDHGPHKDLNASRRLRSTSQGEHLPSTSSGTKHITDIKGTRLGQDENLLNLHTDVGAQMQPLRDTQVNPLAAQDRAAFQHRPTQQVDVHGTTPHRKGNLKLAGDGSALSRELCANPQRRNYKACAQFMAEQKHTDAFAHGARTGLRGARGGSQRLDWRSVKSWKTSVRSRDLGHEVLVPQQLHQGHWQGKVPKVGCITAIPSGREARVRMRFFIDNFKLQDYEGPRELILVYHNTDDEAVHLVKTYADGTSIKGIAARGDDTFPSSMALRYGAWFSDSDIIARWELDAFHHPRRLAMQVRALATSSRPACLLQ